MDQQTLNTTILRGMVTLAESIIASEGNTVAMVSFLQTEISTLVENRQIDDFQSIEDEFRVILARSESRHEIAEATLRDVQNALDSL